ncbi:serine/arginine repetitive matrix protein 1-like [Neocloeon triangulifer]|uniref:serine/arginine repetitive matrix protein 1-like n=1 Tax=Neocloeon triangulifer TaxID=2078957 RepID=UPI00286EDF62|nr:serine/arginine repetitive matrix protein 1-like [Neocloeon triangulifer]XP_059475980.1 serine/arginine repetitive matrix protein 1-like [Neocloeon triangulifer]XP_059475981.1 serine/arginine repetitive matrix protein 1-like [Neocloeon triangulifer]XP_059475982.1 serine/arginine repetitive matrix protein 1-like [Neocloeon triangulifer]
MSRSPSVSRRHFLGLSALSPWDRSSSDGNLHRRRPSRRPVQDSCDQFRGQIEAEGRLDFRSEYRESFRPPPDDACVACSRRLAPTSAARASRSPASRPSSSRDDLFECSWDEPAESESHASFCPHRDAPPRPPLCRLATTLRLHGDHLEFADMQQQQQQQDFRRQRPGVQRPTSLELRPASSSVHANFATPSFDPDVGRAEYRDAFQDFPRCRPRVPRPPASLSPEGPWFGEAAEYKAQFVDFPRHRPEARVRVASLRCGGQVAADASAKMMTSKKQSPSKPPPGLELDKSPLDASPEYRELYRDFPRSRPRVLRPPAALRPEGDFCDLMEYKENFKDSPRARPRLVRPEATLKPEGEFAAEAPEYRRNFTDFPRKRPEPRKAAPSGLQAVGEGPAAAPEYREAFKDFPRQRPKTPRPADALAKGDGGPAGPPEYAAEFVAHPRKRPDAAPRPETTLRPRGPWLGRFPEYRAAFVDLPRQRPVTPRPLSLLNADTLGGGYEGPPRPNSAGPTTPHAHQRSASPAHKRGRSRKKKRDAAPKNDAPGGPATSPTSAEIILKDLPSELPPHIKAGEPEKVDPTLPHAYKTRRSPVRIAPSAVSAFRVLDVSGVAPPEGDDADKGRDPGDGKWGSGWLARH